jgi:hypothetical protein
VGLGGVVWVVWVCVACGVSAWVGVCIAVGVTVGLSVWGWLEFGWGFV